MTTFQKHVVSCLCQSTPPVSLRHAPLSQLQINYGTLRKVAGMRVAEGREGQAWEVKFSVTRQHLKRQSVAGNGPTGALAVRREGEHGGEM